MKTVSLFIHLVYGDIKADINYLVAWVGSLTGSPVIQVYDMRFIQVGLFTISTTGDS